MSKIQWAISGSLFMASLSFAQQPPLAPANETRTPVTIRSINSNGADLLVPLCPVHFHDSLDTNGIAGPTDRNVKPAKVKNNVPPIFTSAAIDAAGKTHIGNFLVIVNVLVDVKGNPHDICLEKSSGYGLDASAAATVAEYSFEPAKNHGKPVPMRIPVEVRFVNPVADLIHTASSSEQTGGY